MILKCSPVLTLPSALAFLAVLRVVWQCHYLMLFISKCYWKEVSEMHFVLQSNMNIAPVNWIINILRSTCRLQRSKVIIGLSELEWSLLTLLYQAQS